MEVRAGERDRRAGRAFVGVKLETVVGLTVKLPPVTLPYAFADVDRAGRGDAARDRHGQRGRGGGGDGGGRAARAAELDGVRGRRRVEVRAGDRDAAADVPVVGVNDEMVGADTVKLVPEVTVPLTFET